MKMTRTNIKMFRLNFKNAIKDFEMDNGISIDIGSIKFSDTAFHCKMDVVSVDGDVEDAEQVKFENNCTRYGFKNGDYQKSFRSDGKSFKFIGFKPQNTKYPCIVEGVRGRYKMSVSQVKRGLLM